MHNSLYYSSTDGAGAAIKHFGSTDLAHVVRLYRIVNADLQELEYSKSAIHFANSNF